MTCKVFTTGLHYFTYRLYITPLPNGSGKASCAVSQLIMAQLLICLFLFTGCSWNADPHVMSDYPPIMEEIDSTIDTTSDTTQIEGVR